jgi:F-type H+-transporting ATPase subunit b
MLIDWFTVAAQMINLLILVWLMKRFLYKPILAAIDAREKRIAAELTGAAQKMAQAQKEKDEFQHKNEDFDQERAALLSKATDEVNAERQRLLAEAQKAVDAFRDERMETLRIDAHNLSQSITRRTSQEVFAIVRKALSDLATTSLEERMGEVFDRRLREMDGKAKDILGKAMKATSAPAIVRSTFALPAQQRSAIQNALNETFQAEVRVQFQTTPDLISGIELSTNGQKVGWTISEYISALEKGVSELLSTQAKLEPSDQKPAAENVVKGKDNEQSA